MAKIPSAEWLQGFAAGKGEGRLDGIREAIAHLGSIDGIDGEWAACAADELSELLPPPLGGEKVKCTCARNDDPDSSIRMFVSKNCPVHAPKPAAEVK